MLRVLPILMSFSLIAFIGFKTLNTQCFNVGDINLSLVILIFSVIVEMILIKKSYR